MSSDFGDDEEFPPVPEDEPIDCYTYTVVVEILLPSTGEVMLTHDVEIVSTERLTNLELEARVREEISPWLDTLCQSPRFKARTGDQCEYRIIGMGVIFGC